MQLSLRTTLAILWLVFSAKALSLPMLDQESLPGTPEALSVAIGFDRFQTFTVGKSGILSSVDVWASGKSKTVEDLFIGIYSTAGGAPAALIAEIAFAAGAVPCCTSGLAPVSADFMAAAIAVTTGDVLAIGLRSDAANVSPFIERYVWQYGQDYAGGTSFLNDGVVSQDLAFRTYVTQANGVPEPLSISLFLLGLIPIMRRTIRSRGCCAAAERLGSGTREL